MVSSVLLIVDIASLTRCLDPRREGIEARRKFVEPVGAWFSQIGRLHEVYHLWQYPYVLLFWILVVKCSRFAFRDLHTRKELRENAWKLDGWSDTVTKVRNVATPSNLYLLSTFIVVQTSQYSKFMDSLILQPLPYSPLK